MMSKPSVTPNASMVIKNAFDVTMWSVAYRWEEDDASFNSSSAILDDVWDLVANTHRVTALDTFTDSNTRERTPYEADGFVNARSRYVLQREYNWLRHSAAFVAHNPTWPTEWKQYMVMLAFEDYMRSGSTELVTSDQDYNHLVLNTMVRQQALFATAYFIGLAVFVA